jgi:Protein of unknown function (DUF1064)
MKRQSFRSAWTAAILDAESAKKKSKYNNVKTDGFDSKHEAKVAKDLQALEQSGNIKNLQYQVPFVLVEGHSGVRSIKYVADFVFQDPDGTEHIMDAKGMKTAVYRLKKKLMFLLHGKIIEEV